MTYTVTGRLMVATQRITPQRSMSDSRTNTSSSEIPSESPRPITNAGKVSNNDGIAPRLIMERTGSLVESEVPRSKVANCPMLWKNCESNTLCPWAVLIQTGLS